MNKISLSFDVEDWYHTPAISGSSFAKFNTLDDFFANWKGKIDCLSDGFDYLVDVLDKHEVTATFFIVADVIDRYPSVLAKLKNSRHEIQCHSLHHISAIDSKTKGNFQTPEEWEKELIEAKKILEKACQENTTYTEIIGRLKNLSPERRVKLMSKFPINTADAVLSFWGHLDTLTDYPIEKLHSLNFAVSASQGPTTIHVCYAVGSLFKACSTHPSAKSFSWDVQREVVKIDRYAN
jgi:peptidoglycan/xylan/chitin deacetylase (PgdA/CDA1 family)